MRRKVGWNRTYKHGRVKVRRGHVGAVDRELDLTWLRSGGRNIGLASGRCLDRDSHGERDGERQDGEEMIEAHLEDVAVTEILSGLGWSGTQRCGVARLVLSEIGLRVREIYSKILVRAQVKASGSEKSVFLFLLVPPVCGRENVSKDEWVVLTTCDS